MRVLLDVHPEVECGPETHILPHLLFLYTYKLKSRSNKLADANISPELVDSVIVSAINVLLQRTGPTTERRCAKDPFIDVTIDQLLHLYPKAQFILMVRDGRAVTNSVVRQVRLIEYKWAVVHKQFKTCIDINVTNVPLTWMKTVVITTKYSKPLPLE